MSQNTAPRSFTEAPLGVDGRPKVRRPLLVLMAGSVGVVFGDIGTSPLYALKAVFSSHGGVVAPTEADVLGVVSLVLWCLMLVVTVAYLGFIMRADNQGEGGILALAALIRRRLPSGSTTASVALVLAVLGARLRTRFSRWLRKSCGSHLSCWPRPRRPSPRRQ